MKTWPFSRGAGAGEGGGVLERGAGDDHLGAVGARVLDLHGRRAFGHHDGGGDAEPAGVIGDALGVVAGGHGDHAGAAFGRRSGRRAC